MLKSTTNTDITCQLADYAVNIQDKEISDEAVHAAKRCLLDWMGVALGGSVHEGVDIILKTSKFVGGRQDVTVIGRKDKLDLLNGALINGFMAHVLDYDDTHLDSFVHPSAPVWPAVAALSERLDKTGKEALIAFVVGFEIETRVGKVLFRHHDERGWHMTGMAGGFGAAAAAGRLLGLNQKQMQQAFGIAATYASGLRNMFGTMTKSIHPGKAAMSGLYAALLAHEGFTSSLNVLEAERGYFAVNAGETNLSDCVANMGESFEIFKNSVKPYSCGVVTHPAIDGVISLRNQYSLKKEDVDRIVAEVCSLVPDVTGKTHPKTGLEGKFSIYYCLAAALLDGECGSDQFADARVSDPQVQELLKKVELKVNRDYKEWEAKATIITKSGDVYSVYIPYASGTEFNPLSDVKLEEKYHKLSGKIIGEERSKQLAEKIWNSDRNVVFKEIIETASTLT